MTIVHRPSLLGEFMTRSHAGASRLAAIAAVGPLV